MYFYFSSPTLLVLSSSRFQTLYIVASLESFSPLPHHHTSTTPSSSMASSSTKSGPQTLPSSLSTARSPTISSNHVPSSRLLLLTTYLLIHLATIIINDNNDSIWMNLNPFSLSLIVFSPLPHHHPFHPHKSKENDSHQLLQLHQTRILVYHLRLLRLV